MEAAQVAKPVSRTQPDPSALTDRASQPEEGLLSRLPSTFTPQHILQLQRTIGNQATIRLLNGAGSQRVIQRQVGLLDEDQREAYVEDTLRRVEPVWAASSTEERLRLIMSAVNTRLDAIGVLGCGYELQPSMAATNYAHFELSLWRIQGNPAFLSSSADLPQVIGDYYHEARHAEQFYRAIRHAVHIAVNSHDVVRPEHVRELVGDGVAPSAIAHALDDYSVSNDEEAELGRRMYEHFFGDEAAATQAVYDRLHAAMAELDAARASGDPETLREAEDEFRAAFTAYEALPNEADSRAVGELAEQAFRASHATPGGSTTTP